MYNVQHPVFYLVPSSVHRSSESRLMVREVVKLVTPGTLIEPLDRHANYLLSVATGPGQTLGLAWVDVSTSEFQASAAEPSATCENAFFLYAR